jgi:hypothetical protein
MQGTIKSQNLLVEHSTIDDTTNSAYLPFVHTPNIVKPSCNNIHDFWKKVVNFVAVLFCLDLRVYIRIKKWVYSTDRK